MREQRGGPVLEIDTSAMFADLMRRLGMPPIEAAQQAPSGASKAPSGANKAPTMGGKETAPMSITKTREKTLNDEIAKAALDALDRLGGLKVQDDAVQFKGTKFVVPEAFSDNLPEAAKFLNRIHEQENTQFGFGRTFPYRPWDGAAAFDRAVKRVFGTAGIGKVQKGGFFSPDMPPMLQSVPSGPNGETLQVPWGDVIMPPIESTFSLGSARDREKGALFRLDVVAPRRNRRRLEAFFDVVADELAQRSIYRGRAINGADMPEFLDLTGVHPDRVIYSDEVLAQFRANVWTLIQHTDAVRAAGLPLKRSVLLEGPYGTGKSLGCALTAKLAEQHGWTFIQCRPGKDDIFATLQTAQLYAPAVVQFEDIDTVAEGGSAEHISRLLDAMDGISNKGAGVISMFTTNHVEKIQRAVMRPGRIDAVIHIGALDQSGVEKLIRATIPAERLGDIDYGRAFTALGKFLPAFVAEACGRAIRYELARTGGQAGRIETDDIVHAAAGLQRQLDLMNGAQVGEKPAPTIDQAFRAMVADHARKGMNGVVLLDYEGDYDGKLSTEVAAR